MLFLVGEVVVHCLGKTSPPLVAISQSLFRVNWNQNGANILDLGVFKTIKDMKSSFAVFPYMNIETINIYSTSN